MSFFWYKNAAFPSLNTKGGFDIDIDPDDIKKSDNITAIEDEKEEVIEALIVETMIKNDCSMKEAVNILSNLDNKYRKKDIYNASLHLKDMFSN